MATVNFSFGSITPEVEARCDTLLRKLRESGKSDIKMFKQNIAGLDSTSTSYLLIEDVLYDVFDGTGTAATVDVVSANALDVDLVVTVVGLDSAGALTEEDVTMDSSDATTPVTTITEWTRIIGMYTEDTFTGDITMNETAGTTFTYSFINTADSRTYSLNTTFWVPTGYGACLGYVLANCEEVSLVAPTDTNIGVKVDSEIQHSMLCPTFGDPVERQGSDTASTQLSIHEKYVNNAGAYALEAVYFYWAT